MNSTEETKLKVKINKSVKSKWKILCEENE